MILLILSYKKIHHYTRWISYRYVSILEILQLLHENDQRALLVARCSVPTKPINQNIVHIKKFTGEAKILFIVLSIDFVKELLGSHKAAYFPKEETASENSVFQFMSSNLQKEKGKNYLDFFPAFQNQSHLSDLHKLSDHLLHAMLFPKLGSTFAIKALICELFQYLDT